MTEILVIKHGALGDIVLATAAFAAIRKQHADARISVLTSKPYAALLAQSPYFDAVLVDEKPKLWQLSKLRRLRQLLNSQQWEWIYDLQNSSRTRRYPALLAQPWPKISGATPHITHPRPAYDTTIHAFANLEAQLASAGIAMGSRPDVAWLKADTPTIAKPYALLVPGGAAHRPEKRWPHYAALAQRIAEQGMTPVLLGTKAEETVLAEIVVQVPQAVNLCGQTSIAQLAELARGAALAIGNDTGPMHVIAAANCPSTVLFSSASDPVRAAPMGASVTVRRAENLADLSVESVLASLTGRA